MEPLNNIDVIILICVGISMLVAFIRGFVKEVLSICGLGIFIFLTIFLTPKLMPLISDYIASKVLAQFVIFLVIMAIFYAIWIVCTDKLIVKIRKSTLSFMDRLFGLIFGFIRAVLILGFCFLLVKTTLPEMLEDKNSSLKKSQYFMMAEICSDFIEKILPKDFIKNSFKSVEDMNKAEKKKDKKTEKIEEKKEDNIKENLPTSKDQKQMDKMFELLVKPQIKNSSSEVSDESKGYNNKDINSLDRLIDVASEN